MDGDWRLLVTVLDENWTVPEVSIRTLIRMGIIMTRKRRAILLLVWSSAIWSGMTLCDAVCEDVMRYVCLSAVRLHGMTVARHVRGLQLAPNCSILRNNLTSPLPENILNCALRESGLGSQRGNMSWVETEPCGKRPWRQGTIKRWLEREKSPIGNTPLERAQRAALHSRSSSNTLGSL